MARRDFTQAIEELDRQTDLEAKKWHEEGRKTTAWQVVKRMVAEFRRIYYAENARREGVDGLFRAVSGAMFHFLAYAKCWELDRDRKKDA